MLETPHVVVGAAIATKVVNPALALPLAFASHFILERVPHWNPHLNSEKKNHGKPTKETTLIVAADVALSLLFGFYIAGRAVPNTSHAFTILSACLFSVLPDLIEGPYYFLDMKNKFIEEKWIPFKKSLQVDTDLVPGLLTQFATIATAIWWINS